MPEPMPFAATIVDQSNSAGFQFEFQCLRCGTGYSSHFHALSSLAADAGGAALKKAGGLLGSRAGKMFGGVGEFVADHTADYVADRAADAVKDQAKDRALQAAAKEVAAQFILCPRCRRWVCRPVCFTAAAGLCQDCALEADKARPPAQTRYSGDAPPPRHTLHPGYAMPSPPVPSSALLPSGSAAPPAQTRYPGDAVPSGAVSSGYLPHPPLKVRIYPSRNHPGRVSLVVVDADDQVIAAMRLKPDDARALADDLLSAADAEMRHAGGPPAPPY
jgi:hypothetical protein